MNKKITASIAAVLAIATLVGSGQTFISDPNYNSSVIVASAEDVPTVSYIAHVQSKNWMEEKKNGQTAGTEGMSLRLEALKINLKDVRYRSHVQSIGWEQTWKKSGERTGTEGQKKAMEAIKIGLTGASGSKYDIYYRVHVEGYGWMGWAKNEESAGTTNGKKRIEAIQICVYKKGSKPVDYDASKPAYHQFVPSDVFKAQPPKSVTCTLISALMMIRGKKFLDGNRNKDVISDFSYRSISENDLYNAGAWTSDGLAGSFWCKGYNVANTGKMNGVSVDYLKGMLDAHPEGVVLYVYYSQTKQHAVYLTDYANGLCCADPGKNAGTRMTLQNSLLGDYFGGVSDILSKTVQIWYIK